MLNKSKKRLRLNKSKKRLRLNKSKKRLRLNKSKKRLRLNKSKIGGANDDSMSKLIKLVPFVSNTKWYNITDLDKFHYLNYHY